MLNLLGFSTYALCGIFLGAVAALDLFAILRVTDRKDSFNQRLRRIVLLLVFLCGGALLYSFISHIPGGA